MFDWKKFILLGEMLYDIKTEESIRTAISRLYYGLFGIVRRYLINVKHKYYLKEKDATIHKRVSIELKHSKDSTERELSEILNILRVFRNHADYDEEYGEQFFVEFLFENKKDIEIAIDIVNYFKNHPNY
ncbi:hypothetical protein [Methanobrevibacter sp.]|uniref:hypothetical protein n=1 Tax=Methanobrevibacter sp. TaxID=66852 RepID=UPI003862EB60